MIDDLLSEEHGIAIVEAILKANRRANTLTETKKQEYRGKYGRIATGHSQTLRDKIVYGFKWEEPTEILMDGGILASADHALGIMKKRGLVRTLKTRPISYHVSHANLIEDAIRSFKMRKHHTHRRGMNEAAREESVEIEQMDSLFIDSVKEAITVRGDEVEKFGRQFSVAKLAKYLEDMFGKELFFDSLLAMVHQYAISDCEIMAPTGKITNHTGFNLAFFGPPGTGKSFAIDDMIRGNKRLGVPAHGLAGRSRYCGGITPVQFIRIGEAYTGKKMNFIIPEFNDWFKYRGMVEPLKLVMEQREVKYETTLGTIGPYRFNSFFTVNYNTRSDFGNSYSVTIGDPNFSAIEDRMLCRLHVMTRDRFTAIDRSGARLELGEIEFSMADQIRDHMTLVYAAQTRSVLTAGRYPHLPVTVDRKVYDRFAKVTEKMLDEVRNINFSPRLRSRAIKLACAMSLLDYFKYTDKESIQINKDALDLAVRFYVEEAAARSKGRINVKKLLAKI